MSQPQIKVLFVDDDASLTATAMEMLPLNGFQVTTANSSEEAMQMMKEGFHPDILCTDIVMPGGSGVNLAREVSQVSPEIKVLLITGDDVQVLPQNTRNGFEVLGKPYMFSTLSRKLHAMLGVTPGA